MRCPKCGKEVPDNSNFCPECGYYFVNEQQHLSDMPNHQVINKSTSVSASSGAPVDASYRNDPGFKKKIIKVNIFGAVGFVLSGLGLFASIMLKFGENLTGASVAVYVVLLVVGLLAGLITTFVVLVPAGKKLFPDGKAKGFLENLPGVWLAFNLAFSVISLVFQGFRLIIS